MTGYPRIVRLSDVERERVTWLWRGRLPFGKLATLDGMPGLGKSTVTLEIAARATTGRPMPGEYEAWPAMGVEGEEARTPSDRELKRPTATSAG